MDVSLTQALLPWLQDGSNEPFGLRVTGLGFAYMSVFPVFMRLRGDELFLEVGYGGKCIVAIFIQIAG